MRRGARLVRVVDGDGFVFHIARFGSYEKRSGVDTYRLMGYRARELHQDAEMEGDHLIRVSGREAKQIAEHLLRTATSIEVEEFGIDNFGRVLCAVYVDGVSLGTLLMAASAVVPGSTMGVEDDPPPA